MRVTLNSGRGAGEAGHEQEVQNAKSVLRIILAPFDDPPPTRVGIDRPSVLAKLNVEDWGIVLWHRRRGRWPAPHRPDRLAGENELTRLHIDL